MRPISPAMLAAQQALANAQQARKAELALDPQVEENMKQLGTLRILAHAMPMSDAGRAARAAGIDPHQPLPDSESKASRAEQAAERALALVALEEYAKRGGYEIVKTPYCATDADAPKTGAWKWFDGCYWRAKVRDAQRNATATVWTVIFGVTPDRWHLNEWSDVAKTRRAARAALKRQRQAEGS